MGRVAAVTAMTALGLSALFLIASDRTAAAGDTTPPALTLPANALTNATSSRGAVVSFIAVATDDVAPTSLVCVPASGASFPVGRTTVSCSATDAASHVTTATFVITVVSATDQLAQLRAIVAALTIDPSVKQGLLDKLDAARGTIGSGPAKTTCNQLNSFGNQVRAQTGKTIIDNSDLLRRQAEIQAALDCIASTALPVVLAPRADVIAPTAPGLATAVFSFTSPPNPGACSPSSPATLGIGTTTVGCAATNANGTRTITFRAIVRDGEPPNLSVPADITVAAPAGSSTAIVTFTVTATDNSGAATAVTCDHASGSAFVWGMTTVTCTAVDAAGNSATRSFHVTVSFAISGRITDGATNASLAGVQVIVQDAATENDVAAGTSGADGTYSIVVNPGRYVAVFNRDQGVPYVEEYWNERFISSPHDVITVAGSVGGVNAPLVAGYYVHGQVTDAVTGLPVQAVFAAGGYVGGTGAFAGSQTGIDGTYRFVAARGAMIKVTFTKSHYMQRWWNEKRNLGEADAITINAETFNINARLTPAIQLSGRVTDKVTSSGIGSVAVVITDSTTRCCPFGGITVGVTNADGVYSFPVPKNTPLKIQFVPFGTADPHYMGEWYDDQPSWDAAAIRSFSADAAGIDAALIRGFFISGHVSDARTGNSLRGINVVASDATRACCVDVAFATTDANGDYRNLARAGTYRIWFGDPSGVYAPQFWNNKPGPDQADLVMTGPDRPDINAALSPGVSIRGHVTDATGTVPVAGINVNVFDATVPCCVFIGGSITDAAGNYTAFPSHGGAVKVSFAKFGPIPAGTRWLGQWYSGKDSFDSADTVNATGVVNGIDARLATGYLISGHVSERGTGAALAGIFVSVVKAAIACCPFSEVAFTQTDAFGNYAAVVTAGDYKIQFQDGTGRHADGWWHDQTAATPDVLHVTGDALGIDQTMQAAVTIRGHVSGPVGEPVAHLNVTAQLTTQFCCQQVGGTQTDEFGNYSMSVPGGTHVKIGFGAFGGPPPGTRYVGEWWNDKGSFDAADEIVADADRSGVDAVLARGFLISGHVSERGSGAALAGAFVQVVRADIPCCPFSQVASTNTDGLGNYSVSVAPGDYKLQFQDGSGRHIAQWWLDHPFSGDVLHVVGDTPGVDQTLPLGVLIRGHVSGPAGEPVAHLNLSAQQTGGFCCQFVSGAQTDDSGNYVLAIPQGAHVKIEFAVFSGPPQGTRYLGEWWNDKRRFDEADEIVADVDRSGIDAVLDLGFIISGTVTGPAGPVENVSVSASPGGTASCCFNVGGTNTDAAGHYAFTVRGGTYRLNLSAPPFRHVVQQWWTGFPGGVPDFQHAADLVVGPTDAPGKDFQIQFGVVLQGHVSDAITGAPLVGIGVTANNAAVACCVGLAFAGTDPSGNYALVVPTHSRVKMFFSAPPDSRYIEQFWPNVPGFDQAGVIDADVDLGDINAQIVSGFFITGHVTDATGAIPVANLWLSAQDALAPCCRWVAGTQTDVNGNYRLRVPPGVTVKVEFGEFNGAPLGTHYLGQWWNNKPAFESADPIAPDADHAGIDARLATGFTISGRVVDNVGSGLFRTNVNVIDALAPCCRFLTGVGTDQNGNYAINVPAGSYKIQFFGPPGSRFLSEFYNDRGGDFANGDTLVVSGDRNGIDARLAVGAFVTGRVTDRNTGAPIQNINVQALDASSACCPFRFLDGARTDGDGRYALLVATGTTAKLLFQSPDPGPSYAQRWYNDKPDFGHADALLVVADMANVNEVLDPAFRLSGRVTDASAPGVGVAGVNVTAQPTAPGGVFYGTQTRGDGTYTVLVTAGTYRISFFAPFGSDFLEQWWNAKPDFAEADLLTVPSAGVDLTAMNASLVHGIPVSGRVTDPSGAGVPNVSIVAAREDPAALCCYNAFSSTGPDGRYTVYVRAGAYRINFQPPDATDYVLEYWNDKPNRDAADLLTVAGPTTGIDAQLEVGFRISGRVTDAVSGAGIGQVGVTINPASCCQEFLVKLTANDGSYTAVVRNGSYRIGFHPPFGSDYILQYWNGRPDFASADVLVVDAAKPGINAALAHTAP